MWPIMTDDDFGERAREIFQQRYHQNQEYYENGGGPTGPHSYLIASAITTIGLTGLTAYLWEKYQREVAFLAGIISSIGLVSTVISLKKYFRD